MGINGELWTQSSRTLYVLIDGVSTTSPEFRRLYGRGELLVILGGFERQSGATRGVNAQFSGILSSGRGRDAN